MSFDDFEFPEFNFDNPIVGAGSDETISEEEKLKREIAQRIADQILAEEATTGQPSPKRALAAANSAEGVGTYIREDGSTGLRMSLSGRIPLANEQEIETPAPVGPEYVAPTTPEPAPQPTQGRSIYQQALEPIRQVVTGAGQATAGGFYDMLSMASKVIEAPGDAVMRLTGNEPLRGPAAWFAEAAQNARGDIPKLLDTPEPANPVERFSRVAGDSLTPVGKHTVPISATLAALREGTGEFARRVDPNAPMPNLSDTGEVQSAYVTHTEPTPIEMSSVKIDTVGGPTNVPYSEYATLGGLAAVSIGMAFAPHIFSKLRLSNVPLRTVDDAAPGTMAISKPGDLARSYDDINAGPIRVMKRAGVDPDAIKEVQKTFRIQTRSAAHSIANSAVTTGLAETPALTFRARASLTDLHKMAGVFPDAARYLQALDIQDLLLRAQNKAGNKAGPSRVMGMTLNDAIQLTNALERTTPQLKNIGALYRDNVKAMRKFEASGEYATLSPKRARELNSAHRNHVPLTIDGKRIPIDEKIKLEPVTRISPFEELANEMRVNLRRRMENEAVGKYIDTIRQTNPALFRKVSPDQLAANPAWQKNTISFYRRGKKETYTTDPFLADALKMDPYTITSMAGNMMYASKRLLEKGATGELAPWFAITSALRSWQIGKYTAGDLKAPSALGSMAAIPQQLYPQMARAISHSLERGSGEWLKSLGATQGQIDAMSLRLAKVYDDSLFARLRSVGTHQGSIMEQQVLQSQNKLANAIREAQPQARAVLQGYRSLLGAVHNAPAFNFARKNERRASAKGMSLSELAADARHLTGDPSIGGQFYSGGKGFGSNAKPIRFESDKWFAKALADLAVKPYGVATEVGRESVPWFNYTQQGIKRVGQAYLDNPAKFTGKVWLYTMMPAAATYLGARSLGNDPNGRSYVDYMMNGRSDYAKTMNYYIPIPGKPAEQGIEFPRFHELAPAARLMEAGLDHAFRSSIFQQNEDFAAAANSFLNTAVFPPMPPAFGAVGATQGYAVPQTLFGGEAYRKNTDPFDQTGGLPGNVEGFARALAGGIAEIVGGSYAAFTQTEGHIGEALLNAAKEAGTRMTRKAPLVRDALGVKAPASGSTRVTEEYYKKQKEINALLRFYRQWDTYDPASPETRGNIDTKATSKTGGAVAQQLLGNPIPSERPGLNQPNPTNPLYTQFISEVHKKFALDALTKAEGRGKDRRDVATGAIGYKSIARRLGDANEALRSMRNINAGNYVTWERQLSERPEQLAELQENKVNYKDPVAVKNYYEKKRQDAARVLLFTIRQVEAEFSKAAGRPITLGMIDPYGKGLTLDDNSDPVEVYGGM